MKKVMILTLVLILTLSSVAYGVDPLDNYKIKLTDAIYDGYDASGFVILKYDKNNDFYRYNVHTKNLAPNPLYHFWIKGSNSPTDYSIVVITGKLDKNGKMKGSTELFTYFTEAIKSTLSYDTVKIYVGRYDTPSLEGNVDPD